jgi:hypothetical protein
MSNLKGNKLIEAVRALMEPIGSTVIALKRPRDEYCHPEPSEGSPRFFAEFTLSEANVLRMTGSPDGCQNRESISRC